MSQLLLQTEVFAVTTPAGNRRPRTGLLDAFFLLLALSVFTGLTISTVSTMDEDIWWHMQTGRWILAHHAVPTQDMFSAHAAGQPWIAYSWLFDVLASKLFDFGGYRAMLALSTFALLAYTAWAIVFLGRYINLRRAIILAFAAHTALMPVKSPRPWLFTILFFAAELSLLWIARERNRPALLLPIVPLFVLWANIHIQFVYGLALIGLFALEGLLPAPHAPRLRSKWLWMLLAASSLATLLNPYGWNLYRVVAQYVTQSAPLTYVQEMQAMPFRSVMNWMALLLICAAFFALGSARRKNLLLIAALAVSTYCGFRSQRDVWFPVTFAILALGSAQRQSFLPTARRTYWIALPLTAAIALCFLTFDTRFSDTALRNAMEQRFPVKASAYIESHALPGPLFNPYGWGGYLIWRLPNMPVSIDGRANLYEPTLAASANAVRGDKSWSRDPDLRKAKTILIEQDAPLATVLRSDQHYRLLYEDSVAAVFEPAP
jgi:hypothetical protein